jgi:hypothetical protein
MKRQLGLLGTLLLGLTFGAIIPLAGAHPEEECECVCPDEVFMILDPIVQEGTPHIRPPQGTPLPAPLTAVDVDDEDTKAIQKALAAIERVEVQEAEMEAAAEAAAAEEYDDGQFEE